MKTLTLTLAVLLAGCQTVPPAPIVVKEPIEVKVPFPVPCFNSVIPRPKWLLDNPDLKNASLFDKTVEALREIEQRRAYEAELEAAMLACTTTTK